MRSSGIAAIDSAENERGRFSLQPENSKEMSIWGGKRMTGGSFRGVSGVMTSSGFQGAMEGGKERKREREERGI